MAESETAGRGEGDAETRGLEEGDGETGGLEEGDAETGGLEEGDGETGGRGDTGKMLVSITPKQSPQARKIFLFTCVSEFSEFESASLAYGRPCAQVEQ